MTAKAQFVLVLIGTVSFLYRPAAPAGQIVWVIPPFVDVRAVQKPSVMPVTNALPETPSCSPDMSVVLDAMPGASA